MLSLTSKFGGLVAAAALAIGLAGAASAATVTWSALPATSAPNPTITAQSGTVIADTAGTVGGVRLSPWQGTAGAATNVFTSVAVGFAEYSFNTLKGSLSFVWGSPDSFNSVQFFRNGSLIDTVIGFGTGKNLALPTALMTLIGDDMGFDAVRFVSERKAFEYGFVTVTDLAPIPVPAAGLLLLTAVGGVAALRRRKSA
jgi:hypothetical protein